MKFREYFELIGNLKVVDNLDKNGNGSMNGSNWDLLQEFFSGKYKIILPDRGQKIFKLEAVVFDD